MFTEGTITLADTVCPEHWARETHAITCNLVYPKGYDNTAPPVEVNTLEYYGPIRGTPVLLSSSFTRLLDVQLIFKSQTEMSSRSCSRKLDCDLPLR